MVSNEGRRLTYSSGAAPLDTPLPCKATNSAAADSKCLAVFDHVLNEQAQGFKIALLDDITEPATWLVASTRSMTVTRRIR